MELQLNHRFIYACHFLSMKNSRNVDKINSNSIEQTKQIISQSHPIHNLEYNSVSIA